MDPSVKPSPATTAPTRARAHLEACRGWLVERFDGAIVRLWERVDKTLFDLAESVEEKQLQTVYFDIMREIRSKREAMRGAVDAEVSARLGAAFDGHWLREVSRRGANDWVEESLPIDAMSGRMRIACKDAVEKPRQTLDTLIRCSRFAPMNDNNRVDPADPGIFCAAIHSATHAFDPTPDTRVVLLKLIERHLAAELVNLYAEFQIYTEASGALAAAIEAEQTGTSEPVSHALSNLHLNLQRLLRNNRESVKKREPTLETETQPAEIGTFLREARDALASAERWPDSLTKRAEKQLAGACVEYAVANAASKALLRIATQALPDTLTPWFEALHLVLLTETVRDVGWLDDASHPAHTLLLNLSRIDRSAFGSDGANVLREVLSPLLNDKPDYAAAMQVLARAVSADAGVSLDKLTDAREQAEREIARRIANHPIPGKVRRFLTDYWAGLLVREHVKHGALSAEYLNALATVDTLLWSLEPKPEAQDRDRLVQALPELLRTLDQGVERIGMPPEERNELVAELAACHADVVCGTPAGPRAAEQPPAQGTVESDTPDTRQALEVQTLLERAIKRANVHIYKTAQNQPGCKGMGSTVATAFFHDGHVVVGHAGDCRAYLLRDEELKVLTKDHSLANEKAASEGLGPVPETAQERVVTRSLGAHVKLIPDVVTQAIQTADLVLLCTDGLTDVLPPTFIQTTMSRHRDDPHAGCKALIDAANAAGGHDNITVAITRVDNSGAGSQLLMATMTDPGRTRPQNEDAVTCDTQCGFVVVCDGVGGQNAGDVASGMAAYAISEEFAKARRRYRMELAPTMPDGVDEPAPWDDPSELFAFNASAVKQDPRATCAEQTMVKLLGSAA